MSLDTRFGKSEDRRPETANRRSIALFVKWSRLLVGHFSEEGADWLYAINVRRSRSECSIGRPLEVRLMG